MTEACNDNLHYCYCKYSENHNGPHVCECGGSWDQQGRVVEWPAYVVAEGQLKGVAIEDMLGPPPPIVR